MLDLNKLDRLSVVVLGIVSSALVHLVDGETLPKIKPLILITASYIGILVLAIAIARLVKSKRLAGATLKTNLRAAYVSALARSPLNPEREAVEHGR